VLERAAHTRTKMQPSSQYNWVTEVASTDGGNGGETRSLPCCTPSATQQRVLRLPIDRVCQVHWALTAVGCLAFLAALCSWRSFTMHREAAFHAGEALMDEVPSTCGPMQKGIEYWGRIRVRWPAPAASPGHCCCLCAGHSRCRTWTWISSENQTGGCHLNEIAPSALLRVRRLQGSVSGLVHRNSGDTDDVVAILLHDLAAGQKKNTPEEMRPSEKTLENSSKELGIIDAQHGEPDLNVSTIPVVTSSPGANMDNGKGRRPKSRRGLEWIVVYPQAMNVRAQPDMNASVVSHKVEGAVVVGNRKGDWLALKYEPGFMRISLDGTKYLQQRTVSYVRLENGTCQDVGDSPINDAPICRSAGILFGYRDAAVANYNSTAYRPEGCFGDGGRLWLANEATMQGHGATITQKPICSSMPYPTALKPFATMTQTFTVTSTASSTTTITTTWGWPSLFCVVAVKLHSTGLELVKAQFRDGRGVFSCEEFAVFTEGESRVVLGIDRGGRKVLTIAIPETHFSGRVSRRLSGPAGTANQLPGGAPRRGSQDGAPRRLPGGPTPHPFMVIWNLVKLDGRFQRHEWTVKVLPSAVFLPSRLRLRLAPHTAVNASIVVANCNRPEPHQLLDAMQVFSQAAIEAYMRKQRDCYWALPWHELDEAAYVLRCMDQLAVHRLSDYSLVADDRCVAASCKDTSKVALQ